MYFITIYICFVGNTNARIYFSRMLITNLPMHYIELPYHHSFSLQDPDVLKYNLLGSFCMDETTCTFCN